MGGRNAAQLIVTSRAAFPSAKSIPRLTHSPPASVCVPLLYFEHRNPLILVVHHTCIVQVHHEHVSFAENVVTSSRAVWLLKRAHSGIEPLSASAKQSRKSCHRSGYYTPTRTIHASIYWEILLMRCIATIWREQNLLSDTQNGGMA